MFTIFVTNGYVKSYIQARIVDFRVYINKPCYPSQHPYPVPRLFTNAKTGIPTSKQIIEKFKREVE